MSSLKMLQCNKMAITFPGKPWVPGVLPVWRMQKKKGIHGNVFAYDAETVSGGPAGGPERPPVRQEEGGGKRRDQAW